MIPLSLTSRIRRIFSSFEDASILRKFTILFLVVSILPMLVLVYLYFEVKRYGTIQYSADSFNLTLLFVVWGVGIGYITMRSILTGIIEMTNANKKALAKILPQEKIAHFDVKENEITVLVQTFGALNDILEQNVKSLEETKRRLYTVMSKIGQGIANMQSLETFLELILETVTDAVSGKVGVLMTVDERLGEITIKCVHGVKDNPQFKKKFKIEPGTTIHTVIKTKEPLIIPQMIGGNFPESLAPSSLFDAPLVCVPLIIKDKVNGVMTVSGRVVDGNFDDEEKGLLSHLASQTAIAIENFRLNKDIEATYFETISALALAVDAKDPYSRGHLERVAKYCVQIANQLGLDQAEIKILRDAAMLHDIGKIGIPDSILTKAGDLTEDEWNLMKKHPEIGESIVVPIKSLHHLCDIIRHHHEKLDGSGYPDGLKGDAITPLVRITTIADIYDALTINRSYRKRFTHDEAMTKLYQLKGKIDMDILDVFVESFKVKR